MNIAIVDNSEAIRDVFGPVMVGYGWQLLSFTYGEFNVSSLQSFDPNLIILDFDDKDNSEGWALLQQLKMTDNIASVPILVYTRLTHMIPSMQRYLASQHITLVQKPFEPQSFIATILAILQAAESPGVSGVVPVTAPILIIDDNEILRESIEMVLQFENYPVITAANGSLGLDALCQQAYRLIILDIQMPIMTGLEFLAEYNKWPVNHVPVLITSGEEHLENVHLPAFVIGRLPKPFDLDQLLKLVKQYALPVNG